MSNSLHAPIAIPCERTTMVNDYYIENLWCPQPYKRTYSDARTNSFYLSASKCLRLVCQDLFWLCTSLVECIKLSPQNNLYIPIWDIARRLDPSIKNISQDIRDLKSHGYLEPINFYLKSRLYQRSTNLKSNPFTFMRRSLCVKSG
jgi:hypothetical protein